MGCRKPEAAGFRATLISLLGAAVIFGFTAPSMEAQHRGFARGGGSGSQAAVPHREHSSGGAGVGGWTNRGGTWSFYTYSHGPNNKRGFHPRPGRNTYAPVSPVVPFYSLPLLDYGLEGFAFDMNDNEPEYTDSEPAPPPEPSFGADAMEMNQAAMAHQIQQLHQEIDELKSAQAAPSAPAAVPPEATSETPQTPVTLVLRNGRHVQSNDYAVMNSTFWDFSSQPVRKIPLSNIDLAASQQATQASGGEFPAIHSSR